MIAGYILLYLLSKFFVNFECTLTLRGHCALNCWLKTTCSNQFFFESYSYWNFFLTHTCHERPRGWQKSNYTQKLFSIRLLPLWETVKTIKPSLVLFIDLFAALSSMIRQTGRVLALSTAKTPRSCCRLKGASSYPSGAAWLYSDRVVSVCEPIHAIHFHSSSRCFFRPFVIRHVASKNLKARASHFK